MSEPLKRIAKTAEKWRHDATAIFRAGQALIDAGLTVEATVGEFEDDRSLRQNRFYWGVVLAEIAEQGSTEGQRWAAEAWHELFKRMFLGYEIKRTRVAGRKRKAVTRKLRSTTDLSVKAMSEFLEQVLAFGAVDLGVTFSLRDWQQYEAPPPRSRRKQQEAVPA